MNLPYVTYEHHPGAERLYIHFSSRNKTVGKFDRFPMQEGAPASVLCVNCPNTWYHDGVPGLGADLSDTLAAMRKIIAESGAKTVIAIGSSMGAFGAVFYGAILDVDVVVAFGPELVINVRGGFSVSNMNGRGDVLRLEDLPTKKSYLRSLVYRILGKKPSTRFYYVCGDMSPVDNYCAVIASDLIGGLHIVVRDAHHASALSLKAEGRLTEFIEKCVTGAMASSEDAERVKRVFGGVQKLEDAHLVAYVESMCIKNRARGPLLDMANLLLGNKCFAVANRIAAMVEETHGACAENKYVLGWSSWKLKRTDAAFEHLLASVAIDPKHHRSQYSLAFLYEQKGKIADAIQHCDAAIDACSTPALANYKKTCADMMDRLAGKST